MKLRGVDLVFQSDRVMAVEARWPIGRVFQSAPGTRPWPSVQRAIDGMIDAVSSVPGVEAVGLVTDVPLANEPASGTVWRADAPGAHGATPPTEARDRWKTDLEIVGPGSFPAMGLTFLRGRNFLPADRFTDEQLNHAALPRTGVVVVNATFASRYFSGEDPVGRTLVVHDDQEFGVSKTIIGVVSDVRGRTVAEAPVPVVFIPTRSTPVRPSLSSGRVCRLSIAAPSPTARGVRSAAAHPADSPDGCRRVDGASRPRFNVLLLSSFAIVALALAAIGIYGVVAFLVTQRTREIGIRMALGARAADVLRLVLREGMAPVALGGLAGMLAAVLATRALRSMLFGVTPLDPVSFAAAPALLACVALLACYVPARRATRVDPLVALREE